MSLITTDLIDEYLECVQQSGVLGKSERRLALLAYLLRAEHDGAGDTVKAYSIGIDVLEKPDDFDPSIDSSVRVEMGRLRTALAGFENSSDATCRLSVDIPVGTYRPSIAIRGTAATPPDPPAVTNGHTSFRKPFFGLAALVIVALALGAFMFFTPSRPSLDNFAIRLGTLPIEGDPAVAGQIQSAIGRAILRDRSIAVVAVDAPKPGEVDFLLQSRITATGDDAYRVSFDVLRGDINQTIWSKSVAVGRDEDVSNVVDQLIGNDLRRELVGSSRAFLEGRDLDRLSPEQLFIMATWIPGSATVNTRDWELERIALARRALELDPDSGTAHSVLADKLALFANFYAAYDTAEAQDAIRFHANRAIELEPFNPLVMFNVAQSHWHAGRLQQSQNAMQRVRDLDPGNELARFLVGVLPYSCARPPVSVITEAERFDAAMSPDNPIRWVTLSWLAQLHINRGDFERALDAKRSATLIFQTPYTTLVEAMAEYKLGNMERARQVLREQQSNWPDLSVDHIASVAFPRVCSENPQSADLLERYTDFATALGE